MNMNKRIPFFRAVFLALVMTVAGCAGSGVEVDEVKGRAEAMNRWLGHGVNLGNALDAPTEGEWGVVLKECYFDKIKEAGFDSVRLPVRWSTHALEDSPYTIDPVFMKRVQWAVDRCIERDLPVILDIHHYTELYTDPIPHKERFMALWKQIAAHFKDYPELLLFEIYNEPDDAFTPELWNEWLAEAIVLIRGNHPDRTLVVGSANDNWITFLKLLELPEDDRNIIVTVHHYFPLSFTHQGTSWTTAEKMSRTLEDMRFIGQDLPPWSEKWDGRQGPEAWDGTVWSGTDMEKKAMTDLFEIASSWSEKHQRPLNLGEYGAYKAADAESRIRWTRFITETALAHGLSTHYWEFCAGGFGLYHPDTKTFNERLLKAASGQSGK